ncbi:unnamed protein product [Alternaria alternata]
MSTTTDKSEQAVAYAALILADESIAITPEKLQTLLKAAGLEDVEPIWTTLFANALKDKNVKEVLTAVTAAPVELFRLTLSPALSHSLSGPLALRR